MSKKMNRAWFICPQWAELVSQHYPDDRVAAREFNANPRVVARLREKRPVAKSTLLKMLRRAAGRHPLGSSADQLIIDTRTRS
jgi:hypothetical protein